MRSALLLLLVQNIHQNKCDISTGLFLSSNRATINAAMRSPMKKGRSGAPTSVKLNIFDALWWIFYSWDFLPNFRIIFLKLIIFSNPISYSCHALKKSEI